jgi:hypothetical protein
LESRKLRIFIAAKTGEKVAGMDENRTHPGRLTAPRKRF